MSLKIRQKERRTHEAATTAPQKGEEHFYHFTWSVSVEENKEVFKQQPPHEKNERNERKKTTENSI